jgi:hypothetical protein
VLGEMHRAWRPMMGATHYPRGAGYTAVVAYVSPRRTGRSWRARRAGPSRSNSGRSHPLAARSRPHLALISALADGRSSANGRWPEAALARTKRVTR